MSPAPHVFVTAHHPEYGEQWTDYEWEGWRYNGPIPDQPIDLSPFQAANATINVQLGGVRAAGFGLEYLENPIQPDPLKTDFDYRLRILVTEEQIDTLFDMRFINDVMTANIGSDDMRFGRITIPMKKGFNIELIKENALQYLQITGNF